MQERNMQKNKKGGGGESSVKKTLVCIFSWRMKLCSKYCFGIIFFNLLCNSSDSMYH